MFGPNETEDRFIKTNIRNYINNRNQIIFKDKYMDFFGISDTKKVIDLILQNFNLFFVFVYLFSNILGHN